MRTAFVLTLLSGLALAGCNFAADAQEGEVAPASGSGTQRSYQVGTFTGVALGGPHNVVVTVGPAPSVRAEGDAEALERLEIRTDGDTLRIGTRRGNFANNRHRPVTVHVTLPSLSAAAIGGSGDMRIDTVRSDRFAAAIGGSGNMEIATLQSANAAFSIAGSGNLRARGTAESLDISVAGSGDIDASDLRSSRADISILGSGDVRTFATEAADINIMGSGNVTVRGSARCNVNRMGSGEVRCNA